MSLLSDHDLYLFNEGSHIRLYQHMGAHLGVRDGTAGAYFAVWAPNAEKVYVTGGFSGWDKTGFEMYARGQSGIWEAFVPNVEPGESYKYYVVSKWHGYRVEKADPFAFHAETPPHTASKVWSLDYQWKDKDWLGSRAPRNNLHAPMSVYEVHLGSWRRIPEDRHRSLSYREIAAPLADYVEKLGFTHVEF